MSWEVEDNKKKNTDTPQDFENNIQHISQYLLLLAKHPGSPEQKMMHIFIHFLCYHFVTQGS